MAETRLFFWLFLLLQVTASEFAYVVGPERVQASVGDDVILPCRLEPPFDSNKMTVRWEWNDLTVHVCKRRRDDDDLQDEHFRGRTSLFHHEIVHGDISLKLTNVTEDDAGLYLCYVPELQSQVRRGIVLLSVYRHSFVQASAGDDVILPCLLDPPVSVTGLTVEWTRHRDTVHLYRNRKDYGDLQDHQFRGRTSLFHHELDKGNISLKLTNVHEKDAGFYSCSVPRLKSHVKKGKVLLTINPLKDAAGREDTDGDRMQDDKKQMRDVQETAIVSSILGPVIGLNLFAAFFLFNCMRRRRRQGSNNWKSIRTTQ